MISEIGKKVIELREQHIPIRKIQEILGCSRSTVSKWCASLRNNDDIKKSIVTSDPSYTTSEDLKAIKIAGLASQLRTTDRKDSAYNKLRRKATKLYLISEVGFKCQACGYNRNPSSLSFHHLDPLQKSFEINGGHLCSRALPTLVKEARKCVVVCANCHGEISAGILDVRSIRASLYNDLPKSAIQWAIDNKISLL